MNCNVEGSRVPEAIAPERTAGASTALLTVALFGSVVVAFSLLLNPAPLAVTAATALYLLVALVTIARLREFHPFPSLGPANVVTLSRGALTCVLASLIFAGAPTDTLWPFAIAGVAVLLDGVDGWLARRTGMISRFGARFDMEIDALLILILSALAISTGKAGWWALLIGGLRYLFVVAGVVLPALTADLPPSWRRKAICVVQMVVLAALMLPNLTSPWSDLLALSALALLCWSFAVDTVWLLRAAR